MSKCLTDSEVNAFVDGVSENTVEIVEHLNNCSTCYQGVSELMHLIEENKDAYDQLNTSYDKMVSAHLVGAYYRRYKKYLSHFIKNFIPSSPEGILPSSIGQNTASVFGFNRYSVIGTALVIALVTVTVQMPSFIAENDNGDIERILKIARQSASELDDSKINYDLNQIFEGIDEKLVKDADKRNAFELGRNIMKIETVAASGKEKDFKTYMNKILSNPLLNKMDGKLKDSEGDFDIADERERIKLYLDDINKKDKKLAHYIEFGVQVEAAKYESVKSKFDQEELKEIADKLEISTEDIEKYNKYFDSIQSGN